MPASGARRARRASDLQVALRLGQDLPVKAPPPTPQTNVLLPLPGGESLQSRPAVAAVLPPPPLNASRLTTTLSKLQPPQPTAKKSAPAVRGRSRSPKAVAQPTTATVAAAASQQRGQHQQNYKPESPKLLEVPADLVQFRLGAGQRQLGEVFGQQFCCHAVLVI